MAGAVDDFTRRELRGYLAPTQETVTVTTTSTEVIQKDPERVQLFAINLGTVDIWLAPVRGLAAGTGVRIPASGGVLQLVLLEDYILTAWEWFGITASGTADLWVLSLRRQSEASP